MPLRWREGRINSNQLMWGIWTNILAVLRIKIKCSNILILFCSIFSFFSLNLPQHCINIWQNCYNQGITTSVPTLLWFSLRSQVKSIISVWLPTTTTLPPPPARTFTLYTSKGLYSTFKKGKQKKTQLQIQNHMQNSIFLLFSHQSRSPQMVHCYLIL